MKRLFMIFALFSLPIAVWADATDAEMAVAVKRLEENGQLAAISPEDDVVKWLREAIAAGQKRLAAELPAALGQAKLEIELVSVPHPEMETRVNKLFVQWKREPNPASFIPLVGRAVDNKMNVFVALEARVAMEGQAPMVFPGHARTQVEYKKGLLPFSAFSGALESTGRALFDEAVGNAIMAAKETVKQP